MNTTLGLPVTAAISARSCRTQLGHTRNGLALVPLGRSAVLILTLLAAGLAGVARGQVVTEFPTVSYGPSGIVAGPDGNLWFTESGEVGRITTAGVVTEFQGSGGDGIAAGPDGNLWFGAGNNVGRITTAGVITEFPIPTAWAGAHGITAGPDGNLWFTETGSPSAPEHKIGRITTAGVITEFLVPTTWASGGPGGSRRARTATSGSPKRFTLTISP